MNKNIALHTQKSARQKVLGGLWNLGIYLLLIGLLWWALHNAPLADIWEALRRLKLWQVLLILIMDAFIYFLMTFRWWLIVRADTNAVAFPPLVGVRLSVFGVSYFTLGPQVGGEPLQILYLQRNYGLTYTRATATVIMDKLLEFLSSFLLLVFGLMAVLRAGILPPNGSLPLWGLIGLILVVTWPLIHIILLYRRIYPLSALLQWIRSLHGDAKAARFLRAAEHLAGRFCQRRTRWLFAAAGVSLLAAAGLVSEYALMTSFLEIQLPFWKMLAAWTAGWLAFLVPLPGGLGALEASQVFALGLFDFAAPIAISLVFLMRGRDLLIGGIGLLLAGGFARRKPDPRPAL